MNKLVTLTLLGIALAAVGSAAVTPEIDPGSGINAVALISGALLVFRNRRKK